jgi:hypothetical protein
MLSSPCSSFMLKRSLNFTSTIIFSKIVIKRPVRVCMLAICSSRCILNLPSMLRKNAPALCLENRVSTLLTNVEEPNSSVVSWSPLLWGGKKLLITNIIKMTGSYRVRLDARDEPTLSFKNKPIRKEGRSMLRCSRRAWIMPFCWANRFSSEFLLSFCCPYNSRNREESK